MDDSKRRSSKRVLVNAAEKEEIVKKKLTEFYANEIMKNETLKRCFNDSVTFLGAGVFGHVFLITAKKDLTFEDFEALTMVFQKDEKHDKINRVEPLKSTNKAEVLLKKNSAVAIKCETAFALQVEHFPINQRNLPDGDVDRFSLYKEYNALNSIFSRYGYHETRGFTKPYAFGRLSDVSFVDIGESKKTKMYGFHFLIFEICGPDVEEMLNFCSYNCRQNDQKLSTRTVFMIGDQLISRMQSIQAPPMCYSHNDLKSDQLMPGKGDNANCIYLIDYGLVSNYEDTYNSTTVPPIGNRRWAPRSNHLMTSRTPLCEIESACYVLLRLLKNSFPWDGMFDRQMARMKEAIDKGEANDEMKSGDVVLYEQKQYLWYYLMKEAGKKVVPMSEDVDKEIEKYKEFFEERNDKWGDGGSQMKELMMHMVKLGDPQAAMFVERRIDYDSLDYIGLRKHLLSIFDMSMYASSLDSSGLTGLAKLQVDNFFKENKEKREQRTECGRPVYYYFPEGDTHCYWEWYCRSKDFWENKPEYWHKVLANREELAILLRKRQRSGHKSHRKK